MKKSFVKNLLRDIKNTRSRFLSIVIIIAVGVAFYSGVRATSPDMKMSGDAYFSNNNLMDFKLISTLGLTSDDLSEIRKLEGITEADGSYSMDAVLEQGERSIVLNINSLPGENDINSIRISRGRKPEKSSEAVVEEKFFQEYKLNLDDTIVLKSGNDSNIEDSLKNNEFKIVGTAMSPLYVSAQRQLSSVGNGNVRGFVYILPEVFKTKVYTEIYVRAQSIESTNSLLDNESYKKAVESVEQSLKDIGTARGEIRYADVIKTAAERIDEAEQELNASKKEAEEKFADASRELNDARNKIEDGWKELERNEDLFNKEMSEGKKQIEDGKKQIKAGEDELNTKIEEIERSRLQLSEGKNQLDESQLKLNEGKKAAVDNISSGIAQAVSDAKKQMESSPLNPVHAAKYNFLNNVYENNIKGKGFDSMYNSLKRDNVLDDLKPYIDIEALKADFDKAQSDIDAGRQQLGFNEKTLNEGEAMLYAVRAELEANKEKIADAEAELVEGRKKGLSKLDAARKKLEDGQKEIDENTQKLKAEEEKAYAEIRDAEIEIQKGRNELNDIEKPEWYVLGRSANVGYETYRQDSDRIDNIGKAFPLIFFLVASLVSLTTMARMVQEKRIEIGTFKALGYSRAAIVAHYLIYSLSASLIGCIIGVSVGFRLFPPLIMNAYSSLYAIAERVAPFNVKLALQASLLAVLFITLSTVWAALDELKEVPASLMRPKPPKSGKRIFLERFTLLWKRMSFTKKVTARNIFRYKQRLIMTVTGIAACTGLMVTGFGLREGIVGATERQFNEIYRYDMSATLTKSMSRSEIIGMKEKADRVPNVKSTIFIYSKNGYVKDEQSRDQDAYIVVPEDKASLNSYINLRMKGKGLSLDDDGVILTEKFSRLINKNIGDTIEINFNDKVLKARVSTITEHYVQHYIYMSPAYYEKLTGEEVTYNSIYGLLNDTSENAENNTSDALRDINGINSVGFKNNIHIDYNKSMDSINTVVMVLIVSAGVLAFVVIYNLTNINISERKRELATIKLLGFYNNELAAYIYRENIILTLLGSLIGIFMGIALNSLVLNTAETNIIMFLKHIRNIDFIYSVLLTILFSVVVNMAMYKRFDSIDMIESLKSPE